METPAKTQDFPHVYPTHRLGVFSGLAHHYLFSCRSLISFNHPLFSSSDGTHHLLGYHRRFKIPFDVS